MQDQFDFRSQYRLKKSSTRVTDLPMPPRRSPHFLTHAPTTTMIYDVNSTLFRSFLRVSAAHGTGKEGKARAGPGEKKSDNKPVMNDM